MVTTGKRGPTVGDDRPARDGGVTVAVRVKPGASRTRVGGSHDGPHGPALVIAVSAPAVDGRATEATRRALATALGVRPAAVTLRTGANSRNKLFTVAGPAAELADRVAVLRDGPAVLGDGPAVLGDGPAVLGDGPA